ncbi:MAG: VOC family protein [Rhodospirillales bacterium]|nr:VOC family protein [Rhodospirillales bacterium]
MKPLIDLPFLSHGHATLKDVEESIRFYRNFLGLDVVKTSPRTLVARLGSNTAIVGVTLGEKGLAKANRPWLENAHFGFDLPTADEVKEARELALQYQDNFNILNVGDMFDGDEGLSFMLVDQDGNYWEILENPEGGYSHYFAKECDTKQALASFSDGVEDSRISVLKPRLLSHMTCEVINMDKSQAFYEEMFGLECVRLSQKRMLGRLNSIAVIDFIETNTEIREHKMHNHIGFDVAGPEIVDAARETIISNQNRFGFEVIHKTSGSHGSYGFTFSDLDNNAWQIEDYPRGGYYWMFEQGGDLENKFQPNVGGVDDWHELVDTETYEYVGMTKS